MADSPAATIPGVTPRAFSVLAVLRTITLLATLAALALWGFFAWPMPWSLVIGVAVPAVALVVWALFVSPRAVLKVHPFVRAIVELAIFAAATTALWDLGLTLAGVCYAVVAVTIGAVVTRRTVGG